MTHKLEKDQINFRITKCCGSCKYMNYFQESLSRAAGYYCSHIGEIECENICDLYESDNGYDIGESS